MSTYGEEEFVEAVPGGESAGVAVALSHEEAAEAREVTKEISNRGQLSFAEGTELCSQIVGTTRSADRTSCRALRANQLRLWFSTLAYVVLNVLRERGLEGTQLATARCDMIRTKLLKIVAAPRLTTAV